MPLAWVAFSVAIACMVWLLIYYRRRITLRSTPTEHSEDEPMPPVSVIVYACDNSRRLAAMLPAVLSQKYPGEFEVVVVNDGSSEDVTDVIKLQSYEHSNLRQTFVPAGAKNLSRKKLAVSLGIKAAKYSNLIFTTAACIPDSDRWLALMGRHFADGREVVLGAATIRDLQGQRTLFDEAAALTGWLSAALAGNPYRGTEWNLGYNRKLFTQAKGFAASLNLQGGDDDIFINEVATPRNCAVELSPGSLMNFCTSNPGKEAYESRLRHTFTARYLPLRPRLLMGLSSLAMWLWLAATAAMVVFTLPNLIGVAAAVLMTAGLWVPLTLKWRRTGTMLGIRLAPSSLWFSMLFRWITTLRAKLGCTGSDRANFTWQK